MWVIVSLFLYRCVYIVALLPILLRLFYRSLKQPDYRRRIAERFGIPPKSITQNNIWLHAVSVGEVRAAVILIQALQKANPSLSFFVTTTTPTGSDQLMREMSNGVQHMYLPYDISLFYCTLFKRVNPDVLIIMETEVWPNLILKAHKASVPIVLANARLSKKSARGYSRLGRLFRPILNKFDLILAQQKPDAARFRALGAKSSNVKIMGNVKFDQPLPNKASELGETLRKTWGENKSVIALASSHEKEEALLLNQFTNSKEQEHRVLMLIPRHPERFSEVIKTAQSMGFNTATRSQMSHIDKNTQVFVGDTMGEMLELLSASDIVIMGGSLLTKGGHNPIEPASIAKPIVMGPYYHNFQQIGDRLIKVGAMKVANPDQALDTAEKIISAQQAIHMGQAGQQFVQKNSGSATNMAEAIANLIN